MAPKRKAAGSGPTAAGRRAVSQGTLAFHGQSNKVSKSSRRSLEGKDSKTKQNSAILDALSPATTTIKTESKTELSEPSTAELSSIKQTESEIKSPLTAEEKQAQGVSEAQIKKYWKAKEAERKAPSIHQEDLSLYERVCRQWDVDGRYGPCMGIPRIKRWKRAQTLGLRPPIEVLAILLKVQDSGNIKAQRAHMDELMGTRLIEA